MISNPILIQKGSTLFLDRDGVINQHIEGEYVTSLLQFKLLEGAAEAIAELSKKFNHVIVVTNQQAIGKGLLTHNELKLMHQHLLMEVKKFNGQIHAFFYAPDLKNIDSGFRKPGIKMGLAAKEKFPDIDFSKSLMVGDSPSDMEFGKKLHMKTVFMKNPFKEYENADFYINSLKELNQRIQIV